ncbi:MAG: hypothetical protein R3288_02730 [Woeseiaceae bacterium]|nr:hypothetical protein [Woeseiaceae bacterium]
MPRRTLLSLWRAWPAMLPAAPVAGDEPAPIPDGAGIERITFERRNIFDLSKEEENNRLYRWINRLHIMTRESTVRDQLLFSTGDAFDPRLLEESERILRSNKYFYDVSITPQLNADGGVDVNVTTRDVWTLNPELSISRSGGANKTIFGFEESNLFGRGHRILLTRTDDVDRDATTFEFSDRQIRSSWISIGLRLADTSDGHSHLLNLVKPFHALDARRSAGVSVFDDDRRSAIYSLGDEAAEYRHQRRLYSVFGGLSSGLKNGWVRRWTAGIVYDDNRFSTALGPTLPAIVPPDRKLVYPTIGIEILEDRFEKTANSDQIERSEDFYLGTRLSALLGYASTSFDADRNAWIYALTASGSSGSLSDHALLWSASASGRHDSGSSRNSLVGLDARYYWRQSDKRLFFILVDAIRGDDLDLDNLVELGGNTGLRGYPLRYQSGDSRVLVSIEQRYFTDWYPWRLFRIGGAVFFDIGRSWGDNPTGEPNQGWLKDVGVGLRFAPTRLGTRKVIHLDVAFPLDGDPTIDDLQVLFEAKRSF